MGSLKTKIVEFFKYPKQPEFEYRSYPDRLEIEIKLPPEYKPEDMEFGLSKNNNKSILKLWTNKTTLLGSIKENNVAEKYALPNYYNFSKTSVSGSRKKNTVIIEIPTKKSMSYDAEIPELNVS